MVVCNSKSDVEKALRPLMKIVTPTEYQADDVFVEWMHQSEAFRTLIGDKMVFMSMVKPARKASWSEHFDSLAGLPGFRENARESVFVIDHSREGPPATPPFLQALTDFTKEFEIDSSRVIYASQNRAFRLGIAPGAHPDLIRPRWLPFDWWHHTTIRAYVGLDVGPTEANSPILDRRLFLCTNRRARTSRLPVLALLATKEFENLSYSSLISAAIGSDAGSALTACKSDFPEVVPMITRQFEDAVVEGWRLPSESEADLRKLHRQRYAVPPQPEVAGTLIDIVNETTFSKDQRILRFTEKTLRSLILGRPFIHVGEAGVLRLIRSYGFRTDFGLLNDSYDEMLDPTERMGAILAECRRLRGVYIELGHDGTKGLINQDALEHNRRWCYSGYLDALESEAESTIREFLP